MPKETDKSISGVFSTKGPGGRKTFWSVKEHLDGNVDVQPLNRFYIPTDKPRRVERETFLATFEPEPEFFVQTVVHKSRKPGMRMSGLPGEEQLLPLSDSDLATAQAVNEENIRANFNVAMMLLEQGDKARADDIFNRILKLEAPFQPEQKHLFNYCGISLRRNHQYDKALRFYHKAARLVQDDENLFHNIARAYFEKGDLENAFRNLRRSLEVNPNLSESKKFMKYLKRTADAARKPGGGGVYIPPKE